MITTTDDIIAAAMSLPAETKIKLAEKLLASLDPLDSDIEAAWAAEAERRIDEFDAGNVQTIPAEQVLRPRETRRPS
jgi:putative addiction module component (TIGR02574 family)